MKKINLSLIVLTLFLVSAFAPLYTLAAEDDVPYGPWVDEIRFEVDTNDASVYQRLLDGNLDIYMSDYADTDLFQDIRVSDVLKYDFAFGLNYELTFNPYGPQFVDGRFNPFSNKKIREAMNLIVDRNYIVDEIMQGLGVPKLLPIVSAFPDYGRLAETAVLLEAEYSYDPDTARSVIFTELAGMGAKNAGGKWMFNGTQITLKILIRTEDQRQQIGDYTSDILEDLGFLTERLYKTSSEASPIWYSGDPADGGFHIYTAGWISTVISRDDADNFAYYYTDTGLPGPLWQAYDDTDPQFYEAAVKLDNGDWETWEERMELMRQCADWALKDSVRVWLIDQISPFVSRNEVLVAADLSGGFSNPLWARTIRVEDQVGGIINAANREVLVEPWNPEAGTNWVYDTIVQIAVGDRPHIYNPYTGLPMPNRYETATIETTDMGVSESSDWCELSYVSSIDVPSDVWYDWDTVNDMVIYAPNGTTAKVKATVNYGDVLGNVQYHDGSYMSLADWLVNWPLDFEQADPNSTLYDASTVADFNSWKSTYKGFRVVSESPLIIEYYTDFTNREAELILTGGVWYKPAVNSWMYPELPWHAHAVGVKADEESLLAYSSSKSDELEIEWMNYIAPLTESAGTSLKGVFDDAKAANYVPFGDYNDMVSDAEAAVRYGNLEAFYTDHDHYWVSLGPFYLDQVDFQGHSAVVKSFNDLGLDTNYTFMADRFGNLAQAPIPEIEATVPDFVIPGLEASMVLDLSFEGTPYDNSRIDFLKYLVIDSNGNLITVGEATPGTEAGQWNIELTGLETEPMSAGSYTLSTIALSKDVAKPGKGETPFVVIPLVSYFQSVLAESEANFNSKVEGLKTTLQDQQETLAEIQESVGTDDPSDVVDQVNSLQTTTYLAIGVALIAALVAIYGFMQKK